MAEGFALADAFVRIRPDAGGFRAEATSEIKSAMAGIKPEVKIGADTRAVTSAIDRVVAYGKAHLGGTDVKITVDDAAAKARMVALQALLSAITRRVYAARLAVDDAGMQARLGQLMIQLREIAKGVTASITEEGAEVVSTKLLGIQAQMEKISTTIATGHVEIDDTDAMARLGLLTTAITALLVKARNIRVGLNDAGDIATVNDLITKIGALQGKVAEIDFKTVGLDTVIKAEEDFRALNEEVGVAFPAAVGRAQRFWTGWATLTNRIPLFAGLLGTKIIGDIAAWHLLADAIIEVGAVLIPAGIAFTAFAIAAAGAAQDVVAHIQAVNTVMSATGLAVRPFTNAFSQLQDAVAPKVYELFGQAMFIVNNRMGDFASLAERAGAVVDMFGARIASAIATSGFQKFLGNAISDLTVVGDIIGNVLGIIGNLIRMVFGVAQVLFHAILDITGALEKFTSLGFVQGLGRLALAMHGFWIWIGASVTAVALLIPLMARLFGVMSASTAAATGFERIRGATNDLAVGAANLAGNVRLSFAAIKTWVGDMVKAGGAAEDAGKGAKILSFATGVLTSIPVAGWAVAGAVALGALAFWLATDKTATDRWISSIAMAEAKAATWVNVLTVAANTLAAVNQKLTEATANTARVTQGTNQIGDGFRHVSDAAITAIQSQNALSAAQKAFGDQGNLVGFRLGTMARLFGGLTNAMGLARVAGIKVTDLFQAQGSVWANDLQQIRGLIIGYQYMGVAQGALGNSVKALQITTDDQITAVNQLNQAWTTMLGIVAGGETTFVAFAQQMLTVKQATSGLASNLTTTNGAATATINPTGRLNTNLNAQAKAANAAATSLTGLNQSSLQYRQSVGTLITDAQTYFEALQTQSAAASDAAHGQMLLQQAGAALLSILGPATKGSSTLRQQVFLLAQQFGFSRSQMETFIHQAGSVKSNEKILEQVNNQLARSVSNVSRDWANMASTLNGQVKSALSGVALQQSGARYAAEQLYKAIHAGFPDLATEHDWFNRLVVDLHNSGLSWSQAKDEAAAYTKGLGGNWQEISSGKAARTSLINDMQTTLGVTKNMAIAMVNYGTELKHTSDTTAAGRSTRLNLIRDLYQTAVQAGLGTSAIAKMIAQILKIPKSEALQLIMRGTGTFSISQIGSLSKPGGKLSGPQGTPSAMGGRVPGTGIHDTVPALLTPGEAVVPRHLVPHVAPFLAAHRVPGFGGGGFVGSGTFEQIAPEMASFALTSYDTFKTNMTNQMVSAMRSALKSAEAAAVAALAFRPGASKFGGSGAAIAFARANLPPGWSWGALFSLWQQESGWNPYAVNPSSGAYGIPQSLGHGHPYALGDYANQIRWGFSYIRSRYGNSQNAWAHELADGWYDQGGYLPPGLTMAWNGTGRNERVLTPGESGAGVKVYLTVQPGAVLTGNATQIGTALGQFILEYTKRGGKLYPQGVVAR